MSCILKWHLTCLSPLSKVGGDQLIGGPRVQKVEGDPSRPVPMVVVPMELKWEWKYINSWEWDSWECKDPLLQVSAVKLLMLLVVVALDAVR